MSGPAREMDQLEELESRVAKAVEALTKLRSERDAAIADRDLARKEASDAKAALERMEGERKTVRTRIEKLLGQIDLLSSGT